jgi:signal transduction histidine kinase
MILQILLIISIILQLVAAIIAIKLSRRTKYNISWMLFSLALVFLCFARLAQFIPLVGGREWALPPHFFAWLGVITSLCFAIGIFYVSKIFDYMRRLEYQRRLTERRILTTILRTEEKERARLAKELHDGLGPLLSSAKMSLSELAKTDCAGENRELLDSTSYVIDEAIRCLREISNNLSPHTLTSFGLARALNNFINKSAAINSLKNIKIDFDTNLRTERFDPNVEVILYRVICELITNSIRHSGGDLITLSLLYGDSRLSIHYSDNGKGFDPEAVLDTGMGLANITSRIGSLHGSVDISSERKNGMRADITINLAQADERDRKL